MRAGPLKLDRPASVEYTPAMPVFETHTERRHVRPIPNATRTQPRLGLRLLVGDALLIGAGGI